MTIETKEDALIAAGIYGPLPAYLPCSSCQRKRRTFALDANGVCHDCKTAGPAPDPEPIDDWADPNCELGNAIRAERNAILERWAWVHRRGSPLTAECQDAFEAYFDVLNALTITADKPSLAVIPEPPELRYKTQGATE